MLQHSEIINNLLNYWEQAADFETEEGKVWYQNAYDIAQQLSIDYNQTRETTTGILAALSPRNKWERNIIDAETILKFGKEATVSTTNANKDKALRILNGEEPLNVLGGKKVRSFYRNILNPADNTHVCIDTWAYKAAIAKPHSKTITFSSNTYDVIAAAYKQAAEQVNVLPHQFQATVWLVVRNIVNGYQYEMEF